MNKKIPGFTQLPNTTFQINYGIKQKVQLEQ